MRKEFTRVLKQPLIFLVYLILITGLIGFSFLYASRIVQTTDYAGAQSSRISEYDETGDIPGMIENLNEALDRLDEDDAFYDRQVALLEESILIYDFLYEHDISYDEFARPSTLGGYQDNPIRFMQYHMEVLLSGIIFFLIILALSFVNYEHATGVYKFIYGTEESRLTIIKRKFLAYALHVGLILFITIFILYVFSEALSQPFDWLIFVWNGRVYGFTTGMYQWMVLGSVGVVAIFFGLGFFAIALYSKNIFVALTTCIFFTGTFQLLFFHFDQRFFNAFSQFPAGIFEVDVTPVEAIAVYGTKYALVILLLIGALRYFNKKDLT